MATFRQKLEEIGGVLGWTIYYGPRYTPGLGSHNCWLNKQNCRVRIDGGEVDEHWLGIGFSEAEAINNLGQMLVDIAAGNVPGKDRGKRRKVVLYRIIGTKGTRSRQVIIRHDLEQEHLSD